MIKHKLKKLIPYIAIVLIIILVFGRVVFLKYVYFDDDNLILVPFGFLKDARNIPVAFIQDAFITSGHFSSYYRPLQTVSFIMDAQFCGQGAFCYHLTNLILHIIFALISYAFLIKVGVKKWISLILVMLFSINPVVVSNVAWIPGRNDIMLGIFFLVTFIFFNDWIQNGKKRYLFLFILFFNLALYSKESAVLLVPIILSYVLLAKKYPFFLKKWKLTASIWLISFFIWFILREFAVVNAYVSVGDQITASNLPGILLYIGKIVPINLSVLPTLRDSSVVPGIIIGILLMVPLFILKKGRGVLIFGYLWFTLLILLSITQPERSVSPLFLEHRIYLPLIGVLIILGVFFSKVPMNRKILLPVGIFIILIFSLITFKRIGYYKNAIAFHSRAIIESPHLASPYAALGYQYLFYQNDPERARKMYEKALILDPNVPLAHTTLGVILINEKKYPEAVDEIMKEVKIRNNNYTLLQLGRSYYAQKKLDKALSAWKRAYALNPNYLPVNLNLALVYADLGIYKEAKQYYFRAVALGGLESEDRGYLQKLKYLENY